MMLQWLTTRRNPEPYKIEPWLQDRIELVDRQVKEGKVVTDTQLMEQMSQWLRSK
jgi:hypothetical protein